MTGCWPVLTHTHILGGFDMEYRILKRFKSEPQQISVFRVVNAAASSIRVTRIRNMVPTRATISFNTKFKRNLEFCCIYVVGILHILEKGH
jgi:hypothetical protein